MQSKQVGITVEPSNFQQSSSTEQNLLDGLEILGAQSCGRSHPHEHRRLIPQVRYPVTFLVVRKFYRTANHSLAVCSDGVCKHHFSSVIISQSLFFFSGNLSLLACSRMSFVQSDFRHLVTESGIAVTRINVERHSELR